MSPGEIITFYSYKGGVGRSMALANYACWLAARRSSPSRRILMLDWDLEAPGLHRYFPEKAETPESLARPGLINYFAELRARLARRAGVIQKATGGRRRAGDARRVPTR